jgi:sec-independent protein translocase protein TatA
MGDLFAPTHIITIVLVALLLFGPSKLPELGRGFGKMLREFKDGSKGLISDDEPSTQPTPRKINAPEVVEVHHEQVTSRLP